VTDWVDHQIEERILEILQQVPAPHPPSPLGRPFMTSYQLAIELDERHPEIRQAMNFPLGGAGSGRGRSMAQYLGGQLSQRIRRGDLDPRIEGAFISDAHVVQLSYRRPDGSQLDSSVSGTGFDLALFRLRSAQGEMARGPTA
jgi:hypothetical protein